MHLEDMKDIKRLSLNEASHLSYTGPFSNHPERVELLKKWQGYFGFYNANNEEKMDMSCIACYFKVWEFITQKLQEQDESRSTE